MKERSEESEWAQLSLCFGRSEGERLVEAAKRYGEKQAERGASLASLVDRFLGARASLPAPSQSAEDRASSDIDLALKAALEAYFEARVRAVEAAQDPITGLRGRGAFERALAAECARALRYGRIFALTLIDLDRFKAINDLFGHQAGDRALGGVAHLLRTSLRLSDQIFRYGGDEFAIISPETSPADMALVMERIRIRLLAHQEGQQEGQADGIASLSLSWGIASFPDEAEEGEDLVRLADDRLYARKRARLSDQ